MRASFSDDSGGHDPAQVLHRSGAVARRLLIVDDEEPILFAMREYFESVGFEVDCAARLEEAETLLASRHHSALIADLRLTTAGRSEGLALVAHARAASPKTRIVLLTAYGSPDIEREAKRLGVGAFLHKPQPLAEIARIVRGLIEAPGGAA